jgi:glycosyltransferase involved in cell wall biosynthesis
VFFNDAAELVPLYCALAGVPVITSRRDMGFWYTSRTLLTLRLANLFVDRIVCNCAAVANEVERREHVLNNKLRVIHNGLRVRPPNQVHQRDVAHAKRIRICLVANIRPVKRIEDFIRAAAVVSATVPESEYLVIGEPSIENYSDKLVALARQLGIGELVRFTGSLEDPVPLVEDCQIGVLTSASEGLSNSLLEYMSCGLAVVCSDVGGNKEIIEHGSNGFIYPVGKVDCLAAHLLTLCNDEALRDLMRAESLRRTERFSSDRMVAAHIDMYRETSGKPCRHEVAA